MAKKKKIKKTLLRKKLKRTKEPKEVLFKVKPLERIKKIKIKKPSKPVKSLVKTAVRPLSSLGKPIPINIIKPTHTITSRFFCEIDRAVDKLKHKIL